MTTELPIRKYAIPRKTSTGIEYGATIGSEDSQIQMKFHYNKKTAKYIPDEVRFGGSYKKCRLRESLDKIGYEEYRVEDFMRAVAEKIETYHSEVMGS